MTLRSSMEETMHATYRIERYKQAKFVEKAHSENYTTCFLIRSWIQKYLYPARTREKIFCPHCGWKFHEKQRGIPRLYTGNTYFVQDKELQALVRVDYRGKYLIHKFFKLTNPHKNPHIANYVNNEIDAERPNDEIIPI